MEFNYGNFMLEFIMTYELVAVVDPLSYFSFQPVLHDWCNKGCGMYSPVCGMMHIKEPLLPITKKCMKWWQWVSSLAI